MTIGMMQGRLSNKSGQPLQSFPWDSWREEFIRASETGFDSIEWLVDGNNDDDNPIATVEGRTEIKALAAQYNVGIRSLCAHTFMDGALLDEGKTSEAAINYLSRVLDFSADIGIEFVVLPVMEAMSIRTPTARDRLTKVLRTVLDGAGPVLLLESDLPGVDLAAFVEKVGSPQLGVLYDIGNANALGFDIAADIAVLGSMIREVHMKDRLSGNGPSHRLGEGDTPFSQAVQALAKFSWQGPVVLETPIFNDWQSEAVHNLAFTRTCWGGVDNQI